MKRVAESQLTQDNADSVEEGDHVAREGEGFDRAPPEVMATRRILKVRRTLTTTPPTSKALNPFAQTGTGNNDPLAGGNVGGPKSPEVPPKSVNPYSSLEASTSKGSAKKLKPTTDTPPTFELPEHHGLDLAEPQSGASLSELKKDSNSANDDSVEKRSEPVALEKIESGNTVAVGSEENPQNIADNGENKIDKIGKIDKDASNDKEPSDQKSSLSDADDVKASEANLTSGNEDDLNGRPTTEGENNSGTDQKAKFEEGTKPGSENPKADNNTKVGSGSQEENKNVLKGEGAGTNSNKSGFGIFSGGVTFGTHDNSTPLLSFASAAKGEEGKLSFSTAAGESNSAGGQLKETVIEQKEFKEEKVETGEEGEIELFRTRAKLYCLEQGEAGARWKERGVGQLKLKENSDKNRARLIMRTEATLRVILNCAIYDNTKLEKASDRSLRFSAIEANDNEENEARCFLVRFSTKEVTASFITAVEKCKGNLADRSGTE